MFAAKDRLPHDAAAPRRPGTVAAPARIGRNGNLHPHSQTRPFVFSNLRTLWSAQKFQPPCSQAFAHSLKYTQNVTPAFPAASTLLPSLFCTSSILNSIVFNRPRALCKKHPGGGCPCENKNFEADSSATAGSPVRPYESERSFRGKQTGAPSSILFIFRTLPFCKGAFAARKL